MSMERRSSNSADRLAHLYNRTSKHGQYQLLAAPLRGVLSSRNLRVQSRYEAERLDFLLTHVPWKGASIADIGGNTGFFSLELVARGAKSVHYIEGNRHHADFVREAIGFLGWQNNVILLSRYLEFGEDISRINVDTCLLLNVLHHIGDDFGGSHSIQDARQGILDILVKLARHTRFLAMQLGFNWKGNISLPLFKNGTKQEVIDFIRTGTKGIWNIRHIGIAERLSSGIVYRRIDSTNIRRDDSLGEFLNRPLFILEAVKS